MKPVPRPSLLSSLEALVPVPSSSVAGLDGGHLREQRPPDEDLLGSPALPCN